MKLILMTRPDFFVEESQIITALFDEGLELLHVRKPDSEPDYSRSFPKTTTRILWCTTISILKVNTV